MIAFNENISVLKSLKIPNLDDFILFFIASRCLPISERTMFKSHLVNEFPSVIKLFDFIKFWILILERTQGSSAL